MNWMMLSFVAASQWYAAACPVDWELKPPAFQTAKKRLAHLYQAEQWTQTFYCGCDFSPESGRVWLDRCDLKSDSSRATQLEWEHIVPASLLGHRNWKTAEFAAQCVRSKDQSHCIAQLRRTNNRALSSPYNLVPSSGAVNLARGNREMVELAPGAQGHTLCSLNLSTSRQSVEPIGPLKGRVARTYLSASQAFPEQKLLSVEAKQRFEAWSQKYPASDAECRWAEKIEQETCLSNPFWDKVCAGKRRANKRPPQATP